MSRSPVTQPEPRSGTGREVSCRALGILFAWLRKNGLPPETLAGQTSYPLAYLMNDSERIGWEDYCAMLRKGAEFWTEEDFVEIGRTFVRSRWARPFRLAARMLYSPREVYWWLARPVTGGIGQFFTCLETFLRPGTGGPLIMEVTVREGYAPCPPLFHVLRGVFAEAPAAIGYRAAEVEMERIDAGARYTVRVPSGRGWLVWLRRAAMWPFAARALARELQEAYEELHLRYGQLEAKAAERKRAEEKFRALLESGPDAMVIVDSQGRIVLVNSRAESLFGYSRQELLGKEVEALLPPRLRESHRQHRSRYLAGAVARPMGSELSLHGRRQDGTEFPVEVTLSPIGSEEGLLIAAAVRDVTQRKRAEEELEAHRAHLAHIGRLHTMGEMVAGIAHELSQPLYVISSYASAAVRALEGRQSETEAKVWEWAKEISQQVSRAGEIIRRLRDFARAAPPEPKLLDSTLLGRESVSLVEVDARPLRAEITLDLASDLPPVFADRIQIQQVLVNLLRNALDAMRDVPEQRRQATVRTRRTNGMVQVSVEDRGCGLPAGEADRLFDAFVTTKQEGMGMGLAISRSIVEVHGGRLWAGSGAKEGAVFHFCLPAAQREP